jgi:hypothetical protein
MTDIKLGSSISQKFNNTTNTLTDGPLNYYTEEYSLVDTGNFRQIAIDYKFIKPTGYSDRLQILANDNIIYETNSSIESVLPKPFNLTTFPGVKYKVRFLQSSYVKSSDSFQYNLSLTDKGIAKSISNDGTYINTINDEGTQFRVASTFSNDSGGVIKDIALSLNSKLYGVDTDNKIVRIDPGAPAPTLTTFASQITTIGILTDGSNSSIKDIRTIEFAKDGKLYVVGANDLDSKLHLYRVDNIESRTATLIGNLPEALNTNYNSILTPVYYTIDVENNRLLTISDGNLWQVPLSNPSSASKIGTGLGLPSGSIKNLVFEGGNLIAYNTTSGDIIQRIKIDLTTGKGVKDGNISGNLKFSVYHDTSTIPDSLLNITPTVLVNNAPIASKPLVNASATQDKPFTLALPAAAFTDPDAGDVLTYSATLADGTPLPAWLKLDLATGTFTGTPTSTNLGNFQVKVTASDKAKATVSSTFDLNVQAPPNNAPVVSKPLVNASATQDKPFTLALPAGAFTDPDVGDVLTYSATLADGTPLPAWLKLDVATGTFTGTPTSTNLGNFQVKVTASDKAKATVSSTFDLNVQAPPNNAPVVSKPLVNASATQDKPFTLALPAGTFTDPDVGDVLTYSATLADGTSLPAWLKLDVATGTFTGTPTSTNLGNFQVKVTASDKAKATAISTFALNVQAPPNNAPVVSKPLVNASATQDKPFTLALPAGTFTDPDAGDVLTYSATLANGTVLPTWLKLDAATGTFTGTPTSTNLGSLQVKVTATDKAQATANSTFALDVVKSPVIPNQPLTLQKASNDGIWNINGSGKVKVSLLSKNTTQLNEIGIFKVDANNKVNGIAPNGAGFAKAAIESGSVVFDVLSDRTTDGLDLSRSFQVNDGDRLGFFLVSNGSIEEDLKTNNFSNVTTSADPVNPYIVAPFQVLEQQGAYTLDWKQGNKDLSLNFTVDNTPNTPLSSISSLQGQPEGEVLDLRGFAGQSVQASFTLKREAGYNDSVSFYKIDDAAGTVTALSGQKLRPGDSGYIQAALANEIVGLNLTAQNGQTVTVDKVLQGGSLYAPILITNVTADRPTGDNVFTAFSLGNADRTDHIRLLGGNTFGFEDLFGGGDKDFNDVIAQASFKTI